MFVDRRDSDMDRRYTIDLAMDDAARMQPSLRRYLSDRSIRSWIGGYWSLTEWAWHGNQGSPEDVDFVHLIGYIAGREEDPFIDVLLSEYDRGLVLTRRLHELRPIVDEMIQSAVTFPPKPVWTVDETIPGLWYWGRYNIVFNGDAGPGFRFEVYRDLGCGSEWIHSAGTFEDAAGHAKQDSMELIG